MKSLLALYRILFARPFFERFNRLVMVLGLTGLGVLNFSNARVSGERHFVRTLLRNRRSPVCFDVGANRGFYSEMVLECCPSTVLHCFEPHPRNFDALRERLAAAPAATLNNAGCGATAGELALYDYFDADGSSHASMHREVIERLHKSRAVEHRVPVVQLDAYIRDRGLDRIHLLKVDTEGHEFAVLQGAAQAIAEGRIDCIHIEFNEMNAISGVFFKQFFDLLSPQYRLYRLLPSAMLEIERYSPLFCEIFAFQNIVALRRDSAGQGLESAR
jgi:FkbM family methyltransferase